jgi:deoxyribonuclease V
MKIEHLHDWNLSTDQAVDLQNKLASQVVDDVPLEIDRIRLVAGVDVDVKNDISQAAVVVLSFPAMKPVETVRHQMPTPFPYVPGLLSFREGPVLEEAFRQLAHEPDVFIFDGMGRMHPRRFGIACHMGLFLQKPAIGCGKTHFVGEYVEPPPEAGQYAPLVDGGETIGAILRTQQGVKPVYISVGHRADLESAIQLIMRCVGKYRLPEPIRAAHQAAEL